MIISIINATQLPRQKIQEVIRAVNRQLQEEFKNYWHKDVELRLEGWTGEELNPDVPLQIRGDAVLYLCDGENEDAYGYHNLTNYGVPYGYIFTKLSALMEENWSVTLSHEALELAMDAEVNLLAQGPHPDPDEGGRPVYHWYELCDAVQDETYFIDSIEVSNFLLPLYFTEGEEHLNHNDYLGNRVPSFGVNEGGYAGFFDPLTGKHEKFSFPHDKKAINRQQAKAEFSEANRSTRRNAGDLLTNTSQVYCEAITFEIAAETASLSTANYLARTLLGDSWRVQQCSGDACEYDALYIGKNRLSFATAWQLCHEVTDQHQVEWAEPSFVAPIAGETDAPDDDAMMIRRSSLGNAAHKAGTEQQDWALRDCKVPEAWDFIRAQGKRPGDGVTIGHPDSGFNLHKEMDLDRVLLNFDRDFLDGDDDAQTRKIKNGSHGLATASVIMSGNSNVNDGLQGPALFSNIVPLRVTKPAKLRAAPVLLWGGMRRLRDAVDYASKIKCGVISMSLGGLPSRSLRKAIKRATKSGVIVLAAAGNRVGTVVWPARYSETIAVAASNIDREAWQGSCRGKAVDITAPGESVPRATINKNGDEVVARSSGTSYAVAITAGVAALWRSFHQQALQEIDPAQINETFRQALKKTAAAGELPAGRNFGAGILDAEALLRLPFQRADNHAAQKNDSVRGQLVDANDNRANDFDAGLQAELLSANALFAVLQIEGSNNLGARDTKEIRNPFSSAFSTRLQTALRSVDL
ncbi:MAG: S8/S53 family peptidase [Pseudomonadales bacterium]|nr:S8/S53 family peptidase [Pseudomonadales bacterium]